MKLLSKKEAELKDSQTSQTIHIERNDKTCLKENTKDMAKQPLDKINMNQPPLTDTMGYSPRQWKNDSKSNSEIIRLATPITGLKYKCLKGKAEWISKGVGACAYRALVCDSQHHLTGWVPLPTLMPHSLASPGASLAGLRVVRAMVSAYSEGTGSKVRWLPCWSISATEYKSQESVATFT